MKKAKFHVTPVPEGWRVMDGDGRRLSELFLDRDEAVRRGEGLARAYGDATLYVHARAGDDGFRREYRSDHPDRGSMGPPA